MNCTGRFSRRRRSSVSRGIGPGTASPPTTTWVAPASRTSSRTASSAGRFPWMSYSAAIRVGDVGILFLEELYDSGLQRILGAHHHEPLLVDQVFEHLGAVAQVVHRRADVGAYGLTHQRFLVVPQLGAQQRPHGRTHPIDDRAEVAGLIFC